MLQVTNVRKVFQSAKVDYIALDGINLQIEDGEFVCLLGPSGCGKSTLLNILAGFEGVNGGSVTSDGVAGPRGRPRTRHAVSGCRLGAVSVADGRGERALRVARPQDPEGNWPEIIDKYLVMVDLDRHREKFPSQLSGGMRQRLQIARALAVEPAVLLMDEPFAALDALTRRRMHSVLLDIWQRTGKTIVFVTHDIAEAITLADRIAIMSVGPRSVISRIIAPDLARPRDLTDPKVARLFNDIEAQLVPDLERSEERALQQANSLR